MRKILIMAALALSMLGAKTLTDTCGETVEIKDDIKSIVAYWHANNNQLILMLGGADKTFVTRDAVAKNELFYKFYPRLNYLGAKISGGNLQVEELLKINPDVVITARKFKEGLDRYGFTTVCATYSSFKTMRDALNLTAQIIGGEAKAKAQKYLEYLEGNIKFVTDRTSKIAPKDRPKVLHIVKSSNLTNVDGVNSIVDEWINIAGGVNAVQSKQGNMVNLTAEEVISIDPDVIIVGTSGELGITAEQALERVRDDVVFSELKAVKEGRVYINPLGVFNWDRYSAEVALQVLWAAKTLHPQLFEDVDVAKEAGKFYKEFLGYELGDEELEIIFNGAR